MSRLFFRFALISCTAIALGCTSTTGTGAAATGVDATSASDAGKTDGAGDTGGADTGKDTGTADTGKSDAGKTDAGADTEKPVTYDEYMTGAIVDANLPGVVVAGIKDGKVAWVKAFGNADEAKSAAVKADTIFYASTLAHTVVGVAVLQLVEQGKLNLDADIDTYLAFPVRNPAFDKTAITLRMLLGLTSTIHDAALNPYFTTVDPIQPLPGDSTVTLATFLGDYLKVGGKDYSTADNFQTDENGKAIEPGTSLGYSDVGVALAAYIVEVVAKQPFDQYCKANIFTPLLMKDSAWHLQDLDKARLATGHGYDGQDYYAYKWYGYPYYAATTFYTTAGDYARVLMMMIGKGKLDAATVLKPESVALLTAPAFPKIQDDTYGLGWAESQTAALEGPIFGNEGGDYGFTSEGWFDPATKTGVVILGNGSTALDSYLNDPTDPDPDIDAAYSVLTDIIDASFAELQ